MKLTINDEAELEIQQQYDWYLVRDERTADRLADLFEKAIVDIVRNPQQFPLMEMDGNPGNIRRARLAGFPLYVLYRIGPVEIVVFAVTHITRPRLLAITNRIACPKVVSLARRASDERR
jgi:plasmid stabilization system protein ParE